MNTVQAQNAIFLKFFIYKNDQIFCGKKVSCVARRAANVLLV